MELPSLWKFVTPPEMPYMSSRALKGLRDYKYVAGGYTWLDRVHTPFWNKTVEFFPLWLAPNLITLIGTGWLVLAYLVTSTYLTEFKGSPPSLPSPPSPLARHPPPSLRQRCGPATGDAHDSALHNSHERSLSLCTRAAPACQNDCIYCRLWVQ